MWKATLTVKCKLMLRMFTLRQCFICREIMQRYDISDSTTETVSTESRSFKTWSKSTCSLKSLICSDKERLRYNLSVGYSGDGLVLCSAVLQQIPKRLVSSIVIHHYTIVALHYCCQ